MATASSATNTEGLDYKYPSWGGDWAAFQDFRLRVELRADSMKEEERTYFGPRLAANLSGRAFDALGDINREELKKPEGWKYLLQFLEKTRGRQQVDLLGDSFQEFFVKKEIYRKENEEISDYEPRFKSYVRKMEKALKESGAEGKVPQEILGWFLLNNYMRMEPSDVANVRGRAESYKVEAVWTALHKMWSGGGLAAKDAEVRRKKRDGGQALHVGDPEPSVDYEMEPEEESDEDGDTTTGNDLAEAAEWYQDALAAFVDDPQDNDVLVNFREARNALSQARTARGFYPVKPPGKGRSYHGQPKGKGKGRGYQGDRSGNYDDRICMRCGRRGHIARNCPQKQKSDKSTGGQVGYVGMVGLMCEKDDETVKDDNMIWTTNETGNSLNGKAVLDSGASDNVIGVETLQELANTMEDMGFRVEDEIEVNRTMHKSFVYGSDHSGKALGLAHMNLGILGQEMILDVHVIEGSTPLLLSARFLYDVMASVNFRTGMAVFRKLQDEPLQLERGPGNHLLLPVMAFAGAHAKESTPDAPDDGLLPDPAVLSVNEPEAHTKKGESEAE